MPETTRQPSAKTSSISEIKKASFWVSQIFVLLATVVGVYLAATQGFQQAVNFDSLQRDRSNYYLRQSLKNELQSNVALLREYLEKVQDGQQPKDARIELDDFVWTSMKNSPYTLETPSEILAAAQKFYRKVPQVQAAAGQTLSYGVANKQLEALVEEVEKVVLPAVDYNIDKLFQRLKANNINL